ncbi:sensor histidine kinase [Segetibacter koreensis]|uniref:sensor histidine kinase n=1 Tax=Segetibacter koreensis TaxID=398037 RepID=UPI00039B278E|nr:HAMP domain-containing sensor histidine kinase [Segetibacter koreensis]
MPARIRITLLFTSLVFVILGLVCLSAYYFFNISRINTVKIRLTNRAITFGRLLSLSDVFSNQLIKSIDSATSMAYQNKIIEAYDYKNNRIYEYSSRRGDSLQIDKELLNNARIKGEIYFTIGKKEVIAYHYADNKSRMVVIAAGEDVEGRQNLYRLSKILLVSFCGGLLVAFTGGYFFSKGLLNPIKKIADDVNDISAQNLSRRIKSGKVKDEWAYLSDTLNSLLNRLQESFDLQKRFIANASHELSTPLTSVSSQIEVCLQRERTEDEYRKVLKSVWQDVLHMSKLTQTLLEFAKASGSAGGLEIALVRIDEVLFRLPYEMAKTNRGYSVLFEFDDMPEEQEKLLVFGNEELLFTAIKNIVINSCKYSPNREAIVRLSIQNEKIVISVQDNGVGIPEAELAHIFQPFYRVNDDRIREGFGLGLSLASRIIKLHNGEIRVVSQPEQGSLFTIHLPAANCAKDKILTTF